MSSESVFSQTPIKTLTFNTQNAKKPELIDWDGNGTKNKNIATIITNSGADIIALQECTDSGVVADIKGRMTEKDSFSVIEYDNVGPALIYNNKKFTCDTYGYWTLGTVGDGSGTNYDRFAVYAKLKRVEDGAIILAVATHFDTSFAVADGQAQKLLGFISENFNGISRVIIMGDYNVPSADSNLVHQSLKNAGYADTESLATTKTNADEYTHSSDTNGNRVLDYIYSKGFKVSKYEVILNNNNPSDHRPVFAEIYIG